jgi:outer membrane receptor protein involved in Fe transport
VGAVLIALCIAASAHAQDAGPIAGAQGLDDIVVTARKRSERLGDVPMSITAVTGSQLAGRGISGVDELEAVVPGFTFQSTIFGTPIYAIRGVGFYDAAIGGTPAVSVYLDQVPLPYAVEARGMMLDLDRVEALKGPQGTLFGQGTTGGALNFIAAKPTEALKAGLDLGYGRFDAIEAEGFVSGPIAPGLTARIAAQSDYRGAWQKPDLANDARFGAAQGARTGAKRFVTGRMLIDWHASDRLAFELNANGWQDRSDTQADRFIAFAPLEQRDALTAPAYDALGPRAATPQDPRLAGWDPGEDYARDDRFGQVSLRGDLDLGGRTTLTAISAASRYREESSADPDGTAYPDYLNRRTGRIASFSQELRLAGAMGGVHWLAGANYAHDRTRETQLNIVAGGTADHIGPLPVDAIAERNLQVVDSYAAFGGLDVPLSGRLTAHGSARYTRQDRRFAGCTADSGSGQFATALETLFGVPAVAGGCGTQSTPGTLLPIVTGRLDQDNLSFRASLDWKMGEGALLYASAAKGYKPGGFTVIPALFAFQFAPVTQESVLAYEAGAKFAFAERRVQVSAAAFDYDYRNKQLLGSAVLPFFGALPTLVNIPRSVVRGAEIDATVRLLAGLSLSGGVTYVASEVRRDPPTPTDAFGAPVSFVGERFPNTPRWQAIGEAEYRVPAGAVALIFAGDVTARSGSYAAFGENAVLRIHGYALLDLRAGVEAADGHWRAELWGRNVTDRLYYTGIGHYADVVAGTAGMPATYGMRLDWRY